MQLAKREKYLIFLAVIVIVLALVIQLAIMPFVEKKEQYNNKATANQKNLQEMVNLRQ
jgi:flagellar basal body-associated protein FliL